MEPRAASTEDEPDAVERVADTKSLYQVRDPVPESIFSIGKEKFVAWEHLGNGSPAVTSLKRRIPVVDPT
jgi:hypothetical protein